jgi:hypothetical protein
VLFKPTYTGCEKGWCGVQPQGKADACSRWALQERERGRVYTTRRHVVHSASESGLASPSGIASRGSRQRKSQSYVKSTLAGEAGGRQA